MREAISAPLAGRLQGISLPDLLWSLCREQRTGVLRVRRGGIEKSIYLEEGRIVFASSGDPNDRLGELFLRRGQVNLDQLEAAIGGLATGKRLGTLLVEAGSLSPDELVEGVIDQVRSITLGLFAWEEGDYIFIEGPLPTDEVITLTMRTGAILLQGIGRIRSFDRIRRSVGSLPTVYGLTAQGREALDGLELGEGEELLVARLEQGDASLEILCREVFLSNFEIYQTLWALKILGVVEERDSRMDRPGGATEVGRLEEESFPEVLTRICRSGEPGVLYVSSEARERTFHIKNGRCVFATSNHPDDSLIAYLLRRGVISLRDREETTKRLLSNKRVGTILRELGVIDDEDLQALVRQQLKEIVYDTFAWEDGDFSFVPGELPSMEEITLEPTPEALVAGGLRRVATWSRIRKGCGDPDRPLGLTPSYLDVLDAMRAGPEEWELINALKTARTPREICRKLGTPDYVLFQALWAMRVLGAIEPVDRAEAGVEELEPARVDSEPPAVEAPPVTVEAGLDEVDAPVPVSVTVEAEAEPEAETPVRVQEPAAPRYPEQGPDENPSPVRVEEPENAPPMRSADETQVISPEIVAAAIQVPDAVEEARSEAVEERAEEDRDEPAAEADGTGDEVDTGATVRLSREDVAAALAGDPQRDAQQEPAPEVEVVVDDWEPPADLDRAIARFNAMQRVIFRTVRTEVGAGAANFIRTCCGQTPEGSQEPVDDTELLADGSWEAEGLRRAVVQHRIEDPWGEYQQLIDKEIALLRQHVSEAKALDLRRQIDEAAESASSDAC